MYAARRGKPARAPSDISCRFLNTSTITEAVTTHIRSKWLRQGYNAGCPFPGGPTSDHAMTIAAPYSIRELSQRGTSSLSNAKPQSSLSFTAIRSLSNSVFQSFVHLLSRFTTQLKTECLISHFVSYMYRQFPIRVQPCAAYSACWNTMGMTV